MARILIVEDSPEAQELARRALRDSHDLAFAGTGSEAIRQAAALPPDLFLVDVGLPDFDGFELCAQFKSNPILDDVPVVFLTSRGESPDKVLAFTLGADDYLAKPFDPPELRARVDARLRASKKKDSPLAFSDMQLDPVRQEVLLRTESREWSCDLTPHEFRLLHCLAARRGVPVSRRELMEAAWAGVKVSERTVDTHMSNLRKKLSIHSDRLEAVRGVGYRLKDVAPDGG